MFRWRTDKLPLLLTQNFRALRPSKNWNVNWRNRKKFHSSQNAFGDAKGVIQWNNRNNPIQKQNKNVPLSVYCLRPIMGALYKKFLFKISLKIDKPFVNDNTNINCENSKKNNIILKTDKIPSKNIHGRRTPIMECSIRSIQLHQQEY